jgi:hypothetical protein
VKAVQGVADCASLLRLTPPSCASLDLSVIPWWADSTDILRLVRLVRLVVAPC